VQDAGALAGYLYRLSVEGALVLVCATHDEPLPEACKSELAALLTGHGNTAFETELLENTAASEAQSNELMTLVEDSAGIPLRARWPERRGYWFALSAAATSTLPAGALVLAEGSEPIKRSRKLLLERLAAAITR
jgi:hypothetical protein